VRRAAVAGLALVLSVPALASAHHEIAIAEWAIGTWGVLLPAAVLAVLHAIDSLRFWWRDGARLSFVVGRWHVYASRGLSGGPGFSIQISKG
jgi:hypothetical protein